MKIALVSHTPHLGGAERMLLNLARLYRNDPGMCIVLLHPALNDLQGNIDAFLPAACDRERIAHYTVPGTSNYIFMNEKNRNRTAHENAAYQKELEKAYLALAVDAVLVNTLTSAAPVMAARALGLPTALWVHGVLDAYLIGLQYSPSQRLLIDRLLLSLCHETVCCSAWTANFYEAVLQKPLEVIPNWTEPPQGTPPVPEDRAAFVCLTTLDEQKGVFVLLEAARQLRERGCVFTLRIYGDGKEQKRIRAFIGEHRLGDAVELLPRTKDLETVYAGALCVVQPSFLESFGMTVLEGMAHGCPVIATASGGPCALVEDGVTGYLVPRGDARALADKMAYLLEHPQEAQNMGHCGSVRYQTTYSMTRAKERFDALFGRLAESRKASSPAQSVFEDTLSYIFRVEDTLPYRIRTEISRRKQLCMRLLFRIRRKLGKIKHKLICQ